MATALAAVREIIAHPEWTQQLNRKIKRFREQLQSAGLNTLQSQSQIIPVMIGDNEKAMRIAARLKENRIVAAAIRPPTVPQGTARLRLSLSLAHEDGDLDRAANAIIEACRSTQ
ncbi:MAG: aminotransferase class I/II-fold pyridoxal phosphate-dependent enzyme [Kiritimatiellae bacterium]|nr:aminotransferase class I/II-fold pyridoxal phosphate-dependent enzyme [Kiritimatiellia bacterium]